MSRSVTNFAKRVSDAVAEQNSSSHFAKRFATGLVTGNADDVASLSGTVAGDLFVFGDIRDVVREGKHLADGRGYRPAGAGACRRGPCGDGGDLCLGRRRRAGARRAHAGQGCPQGRAARRGPDAVGRPFGARDGRRADAAAGGRLRVGAAAGSDHVAIKAAFRAEKAGALVRLAKDVGRVGEKAGVRAAR